jgi:enoyl-CoA hydratase/carnithine racemase
MDEDVKTIPIPRTYVTAQDSHVRVTNYPEAASGVTPIQVVIMNRPDKLNAITGEMINTLTGLLATYDVDDRVKVIILTGAGDKAFSAGIDLKLDMSMQKNRPVRDLRDPGGVLALAMFNCSKTIIVAYNGLSVGIGMTSTLAAAIRYVILSS